MCFSLQPRAIFPHLNFKKWSETVSFLRFWLENVLLATAACNFSTSQLQKVVRPWGVLYILTWKCASRNSGVQFFHIATSKSAPRPSVFLRFCTILTSKCASRYSGVQFFHIATSKSAPRPSVFYDFDFKMCFSLQRRAIFHVSSQQLYLRTRRFSEVTFRPSRHTNHWKTQHFATSLTFRACASSFYSLSRHCIFFLLTLLLFSAFSIFWLCFSALLFQLSILSEVRLLNFLRSYIPSLKLTVRTWKWMVGILVSLWDALFSGAMLVSGSVSPVKSIWASKAAWSVTWTMKSWVVDRDPYIMAYEIIPI